MKRQANAIAVPALSSNALDVVRQDDANPRSSFRTVGSSAMDSGPNLYVTGRLRELAGRLVFGQPYALHVEATDRLDETCYPTCWDGVKSIYVQVDGQTVASRVQRDCYQEGCRLALDYAFHPNEPLRAAGVHTIRVIATNFAGEGTSVEWTVVRSIYADRTEDEVLQDSLEFRQDFGLNQDPSYIDGIMHDPALESNWEYYDVPLTADELATVDLLNEDGTQPWGEIETDAEPEQASAAGEQSALVPGDPIERYGETEAAGVYAGSHIAAGHIMVGFTRDASFHLKQLRQRTSKPLAAFNAQYSLSYLRELQERVTGDWEELRSVGVQVTEVGVDIPANAVLVGTKPLSMTQRQLLRDRYGPAVRLATSDGLQLTADRWERHDPVIGGLRIVNRTDDLGCTSAFSFPFTVKQGQLPITRNGVLTAGHCGSLDSEWWQGDTYLGFLWRRHFVDGGSSDSALIVVDARTVSNNIYVNQETERAVTRIQEDDRIGQVSCVSGARTARDGNRCGKLVLTNDSFFFQRDGRLWVLRNMRKVRPYRSNVGKMCDFGNSGAPVYRTSSRATTAKGILSGEDSSGRCVYSHIQHVLNDLNLRMR